MSGAILRLFLATTLTLIGSGSLLVAGDILRGGASSGSGRKAVDSRANAGAAAAELARTKATDRLARTTQVVTAMRQMQVSARSASGSASVPEGLTAGGLERLPGGAWTGANAPAQSGNLVTIKQTDQQAVLNWKTFNVGRNTTVNFDQSAGGSDTGKWIAFNKVTDPSGQPSKILGSIKADGQVYIINGNGIIFGAGSQVNTHTLVASALPINDNLISRGLLNNPDAQFLFSSTALAAGSKGPTPAFTPPAPTLPDGRSGDVIVERGAELTAPTTAEKVGGRITLIGANVVNEGSISVPDGQAILAAGLQVGFAAHPGTDPTLRGLDVYVGNVNYTSNLPPSGEVSNLGIIEAPRANVTMIGRAVRQSGVIESSTTTALNGRVDLIANYGATTNPNYDFTKPTTSPLFYNKTSGTVELHPGSVLRIVPELSGTDRAIGTQLALPSLVNIQGRGVDFAAGSTILATGAALPTGSSAVVPRDGSRDANKDRLDAGVSIRAGNWVNAGLGTVWAYTGGQIYLDAGATIDVTGSVGVSVPLTHSLLTVQLRGSELANSPLQRSGPVRGTSITVDIRKTGTFNGQAWMGTPLGDVSGYAGIIERGVGELTTAGGTVSLSAGEAVVMQRGSRIDVSGGWMQHEAGMVRKSRLLANGSLVDITAATPDRQYDGIYTEQSFIAHAKWGVSYTYRGALSPIGEHYQTSYIQGADSGTISISAPSMALDGTLQGQAVQGPRQSSQTALALAKRGTLNLTFQASELLTPQFNFSPTPPRITFAAKSALPPAAAFSLSVDGTPDPLIAERKSEVVLSPALLTEGGFGTLMVDNSDGDIIVPEGTPLEAPLQGSITLRAANITIQSPITAPGGTLAFTVFNISPFLATKLKADSSGPVTPQPTPGRGVFLLGTEARLNTAGLVTDYLPGPQGTLPVSDGPPLVNGGSVAIDAYTARLADGSVVDVSGGLSVSATGKRTFGTGGSITINAGRDPGISWVIGGRLALDATLIGYSGGKGGSLTVQAPRVQIGGVGSSSEDLLALTPEFFSSGGFTSFTMNALGEAVDAALGRFLPAIVIDPGTVIKPVAESWRSVRQGGTFALRPFVKPEGLRTPVSLTFSSSATQDTFAQPAQNILRGDIIMGAGSLIETDPRAAVTFRGSTVAILGSIIAPGGSITISGANAFPSFIPSVPLPEFNKALPTVHIGPASVLSTAGRVVLTPDPYGRRIGSVLPGGTITVSGNIVAEAGAVLDVSGASGILDLPPASLAKNISAAASGRVVPVNSGVNSPLYSRHTVPTVVESDAGAIILRGGQELFTDATLRGFAGGPSAGGGSLSISSGRFYDPLDSSTVASPLDVNLVVTQSGATTPSGFYPSGGTAIGQLVPVATGNANEGRGHFTADTFLQGGFDSLKLSGTTFGAVGFSGQVSIIARRSLSVAEGGVISADSSVYLEAPYVALGTAFLTPLQISTTQANDQSIAGPTYVLPSSGPGRLTVRASLIDIGNLSLQNISRATFIARGGDIRGNGALNIAGAVEFIAGQLYPTTAGRFTIVAYDPSGAPGTGSITISGAGERPTPYSAGGILSLYASTIIQGGTLRAPFGTINLGWDGTGSSPKDYLSGAGITSGRSVPVTQQLTLASGSVTSVSAVDSRTGLGLLIPYGFNTTEKTWIDPTGIDITAVGSPAKAVNLSAVNLSSQAGARSELQGGGDL